MEQVEVKIGVQTGEATAGFEAVSAASKRMTDEMNSQFQRASDSAKGLNQSLKIDMSSLIQGVAIGQMFGEAISAAFRSATSAVVSLIHESAMLNARYETLGVVQTVVGKNAGYTKTEMDSAAESMRKMGISMMESRDITVKMAQAQIDLSLSTQLARIAQDAAVVGNINSSEALKHMMYGIQSAQVDVLRTIGINVNFEDSYKKLAAQLHKTKDALTEHEKMQARVNSVMEEGTKLAGAYEAAMGTAGKQLTSIKRYQEDFRLQLGETFNEATNIAVMALTEKFRHQNAEIQELSQKGDLKRWGADIVNTMAVVADSVNFAVVAFKQLALTMAMMAAVAAHPTQIKEIWAQYRQDMHEAAASVGMFSRAVDDRRATLAKDEEEQKASYERRRAAYAQYVNALVEARGGKLTAKDYKDIQATGASMLPEDVAAAPDKKDDTSGSGKKSSRMSEFDDRLNLLKLAHDKENVENGTHFEYSKEMELKYWQDVLSTHKLSAEEKRGVDRKIIEARTAISKEGAALELADIRSNVSAYRAGSEERINAAMNAAVQIGEKYGLESKEYRQAQDEIRRAAIDRSKELQRIEQTEIERKAAASASSLDMDRQQLANRRAVGEISAAEELQALKSLEDKKFQIELQAAEDRAALLPQGSAEQGQAYAKIEQMKQKHALNLAKIDGDIQKTSVDTWKNALQPIQNGFNSTIQGILQGTQTLQQGMRNIFQNIVLSFAQMGVQMVTNWASVQLANLTASRTGAAAEQTLKAQTAATTTATAIQGATVEVGAKAAGAGAGAAQAVAPTPFVGPALAAAAFAAVMAMVLGAKSVIPSAAGGFDIPAGVNPLTQLHEREMVLPAKHADVIRSMAEGNGSGGGGGAINVSINAVDARSVSRLFDTHGGALVDAIRSQARNFKTV